MKATKNLPGNILLGAGLLLTSAALLLGEAELVSHGVKLALLALLVLAVALELRGSFQQCKKQGNRGESR